MKDTLISGILVPRGVECEEDQIRIVVVHTSELHDPPEIERGTACFPAPQSLAELFLNVQEIVSAYLDKEENPAVETIEQVLTLKSMTLRHVSLAGTLEVVFGAGQSEHYPFPRVSEAELQ